MSNPTQETKNWIQDFVIKHDLCPFAHEPFEKDELYFQEFFLSPKVEDFENLKSNLFLIYPESKLNFEDFYEEVESFNQIIQDFHLIAFHPEFCFQGLKADDIANLVNKSPYPMVHIISQKDFDLAKVSIKQGESISLINEKKLKKIL